MNRRYARAYAIKYQATFDKPRPMASDEREFSPYPNVEYGPKFWELLRLYASRAWTDAAGRERFIITKTRIPELEQAYKEHMESKQEPTEGQSPSDAPTA